jgi:hypothetical protein
MYSKLTKFLQLFNQRKSPLPHFCLAVTFTCLSFSAVGQLSKNYVRVELKSGVTIEGEMVKIEYQKQVDVLIAPGDTLFLPWADISTLNFIEKEVEQRVKYLSRPKKVEVPFNDTGFYYFIDFGVPVGIDYWGDPVAGGSVNFGYGKGFNYNHHVAATVGYDAYLWPDVTVIPLGLEYYGRFKEQKKSWFYYYGMGYSWPHLSEYSWFENPKLQGGMFFSPGFGFTNKRHQKRSWYLKFGYKYQTLKASYDATVWEFGSNRIARVDEEIFYHRFDIRFGIRFD